MNEGHTFLIVFVVIMVLIAIPLYIIAIKGFFKDYVGKLVEKKQQRVQPLSAATLKIGDKVLIKERVHWRDHDHPIIVKTFYKVKERKPSSVVFVRKDDGILELPYHQVDSLISNGAITDY